MKCEVEFLAVGDASRAGDAIVVRYGEEDDYRLMVVDGGTASTGEVLVQHLKNNYGANVCIEHVVLTHSDADHASGLRELFKEIPVANLWMHIPWLLSEDAIHLFSNKSWTKEGLSKAIKQEYSILSEILELAWDTSCQVRYPFEGVNIGPFTVLSPSKYAYLNLLPQFDKTPDPDKESIEAANMWIGKENQNLLIAVLEALKSAVQKWIKESWTGELLKDGGCTSASNESSVVLYADMGENRRLLLTGDAGVNALWWAADYAQSRAFQLQAFSFVQIPHHGSRRNVGPSVLNRLIGPIQPEGTQKFSAFVSAPVDDSKHPRKIVLNAFMRRGGKIFATQGQSKTHWGGFKPRDGYSTVEPNAFSPEVEEYD